MPHINLNLDEKSHYHGVRQFAEQARWNIIAAHDTIIEKRVEQTHYANQHRSKPPTYKVADLVYLT